MGYRMGVGFRIIAVQFCWQIPHESYNGAKGIWADTVSIRQEIGLTTVNTYCMLFAI